MNGKISEVFLSVQGEGLYFGEKQIFVRFYGCNLRCKFCDTVLSRYMEYSPEELFSEIALYGQESYCVSFTGGEPLVQQGFLRQAMALTSVAGYTNYLETNGTLADELTGVIDFANIISMDIKLPSSTGLPGFWKEHRRFLKTASQKEVFVKCVIGLSTNDEDLKQAVAVIREANRAAILVLQAVFNESSDLLQAKMERFKSIATNDGVLTCIIPQMHHDIGVP